MTTPENTTPAASSNRRNYLLIGAIALVAVIIAVGAAIFLLNGGDDEAEAKGSCQNTTYELSAERDDEDNRMTASLEVKAGSADETWDVVIASNGKSIVDESRTTDAEAELDVDAFIGTGEQPQTVKATFGPQDGETCTATVELG